ncbi:haptoglobin [Brachyhypopomus gauderio]|uniref:haptoglobin n=1 Tax=Brachyhypopomus gauderio TaxID=698409 RepID=UPI004042C5A2
MKWLFVAVFLVGSMICLSVNTFAVHRSRRMVGGSLVTTPVPWQAMVFLSENILDGGFAGGALIAPRWVLTAGRNLFVRKSREHSRGEAPLIPKVYLGISRRAEAGPATEVAVEKVFLHPGFQNQTTWDDDLALIQLKEPVIFTNTVFPIPLPERGEDLAEKEGQRGIITGWGWGVHLTPSEHLKFLSLAVVSVCGGDKKLCTEPSRYDEDVCFGDAGGALAFLDPETGRVYAGGILSNDKACGAGKRAVYTKVSAYLPWIQSVMRGDSDRFSSLRTSIMKDMLEKQP